MEKKQVRFTNVKEMLTRDQMKKIKGGTTSYKCCTDGNDNQCSSCAYTKNDTCPTGAHLVAC